MTMLIGFQMIVDEPFKYDDFKGTWTQLYTSQSCKKFVLAELFSEIDEHLAKKMGTIGCKEGTGNCMVEFYENGNKFERVYNLAYVKKIINEGWKEMNKPIMIGVSPREFYDRFWSHKAEKSYKAFQLSLGNWDVSQTRD